MRLAKLHIRFAIPIFAVGAIALALALPTAASAAEFSLTIETASGTGYGEVNCKVNGEEAEPCASEYESGTKLVLVPVQEEGSKFAGFKSGTGSAVVCTGTAPCSFTLQANSTVEAPFDLILKKLVVTVTGEGQVECEGELLSGEPCNGEYPIGSEITLTPTAEFGYEFAGFKSGTGSAKGCVGTDPCTFTLEMTSSVNALFERIRYVLTIKKAGTGSGTITSLPTGINCGVTCEAEFEEGKEVTLTATASAGSEFVEWGECDVVAGNECQVEMNEERAVEAVFNSTGAVEEFNLKVNKAGTGSGKVTSSPGGIDCGSTCEAEFEEGKEVTLTATATGGSKFTGWSGSGCPGTGTCKVTMSAAKEVTATFTPNSAPPPPPPPKGTAKATATATAKVKAGKAQLKLTCSGGACKGTLKLTAKIKQGKTLKNLMIGKASFSLAAGASTTLKVKLSSAAKQAMKGGKTLKAKVSGSGVQSRTVKLKS